MAKRYDDPTGEGDPRAVPAEAVRGNADVDLPAGASTDAGRKGGAAVFPSAHPGSPAFGGGAAVIEPFAAAERQAVRPHSDELALAAEPIGRTDEIVDANNELVHPFRPDWLRAFQSGLFATTLFTFAWYPLPFIFNRWSLDPGLVIGSALWPQADMVARLIGLAVFLGAGIALAMAYAHLLAASRIASDGRAGTLFGLGTGVAVLAGLLPIGLGLIARFSPYHPYFDQTDFLLQRVSGGEGGDTAWAAGLYALGLFAAWGAMIGGLYRHRLTRPVAREAVSGQAPFYYEARQ
jgi:hypothetical protein